MNEQELADSSDRVENRKGEHCRQRGKKNLEEGLEEKEATSTAQLKIS